MLKIQQYIGCLHDEFVKLSIAEKVLIIIVPLFFVNGSIDTTRIIDALIVSFWIYTLFVTIARTIKNNAPYTLNDEN